MNKFRIILMLVLVPIIIAGIITVKNKNNLAKTVRAFGDLAVTYLGVPLGAPIFSVTNMAPGDPAETRTIDVNNGGVVARLIAVKGIRTGPSDQIDPKIEHVLHLVLTEDGITKFDGTLENFFTQSGTTDGFLLSAVNPTQTKHYTFTVDFPSTANSDYQYKSVVFDITFGTVTAEHIIINEVYYKVDPNHGLDSIKDRGGKTKDGINNEWVELYNPTTSTVNLKNWSFTDNSGTATKINSNTSIGPGAFLLVSKDASTWKYWSLKLQNEKINLGTQNGLGDGLDNTGDRVVLKNAAGTIIDQVGWVNDTNVWNPAVPNVVTVGHSIERLVPGFDTDQPTDWQDNLTPSPGN